ncbi:nuclear protein Sth1p/NPS1 [Monosporozyma unispora]|nr:RSC chromatin remodeling complex ATPase component [Kazachstania unispora]
MLESTSSVVTSTTISTTEPTESVTPNPTTTTSPLDNSVDQNSVNNNYQDETNKEVPIIHIPKPKTLDQLDQLFYRYRSIYDKVSLKTSNDGDENFKNVKLEIEAIERVFLKLSEDQQAYIQDLNSLNEHINQDTIIDNDLVSKQILALQLLEKNMDIPDGLIEDYEPLNSDPNSGTNSDHLNIQALQKISLSPNFDVNAKNFGLDKKFTNNTKSVMGSIENEEIVSNQIAQRIYELERLPGNIGTYSLDDSLEFLTKDDLPTNIDKLKLKALVELKSLKLLTKQKQLRQKLINNVTSQAHHQIPELRDSPYTMAAQRSVQVRTKVIVPQTARIAEELERQQFLEKRKKERSLQQQKINLITEYQTERIEAHWTLRDRCNHFGKLCQSAHTQIEKDEQKRIERTAKQRLAALKSNDEEAYLKLLDQTKDTRITQLLRQTNSFLDSLSQAVRVQQNEAKILRGEEIPVVTDEEREKIDYYEVAHRVKEKIDKQPSILVGGTLKEYQLKGLEWMVSLYNNHLNGILADEMGLGKTIQSISLITYLYEAKNNPGPYLVIVPLSTITNWTLEFEKWAPSLTTVVYKGTPGQRKSMQHQIRVGNFDVLLTTYEYIIKDRPLLSKHEWAHMIIDEGHRMKNAQSKLSYTIQHYYKTKNRLILTGTPLQNNLPELWALLNFVLPKIFNSAKTFEDWFNTPFANTGTQEKLELTEEETLLVIRRLHKVLRPFLLRRLKKEVEKDLPDKVEKVIKCKLSGLQQQLYQQMLKHNALFVGAGTEGATKSGIKGLNNKIMQLRKICNHPFVFDEVEGVVNPSRGNSSLLYRVSGKFELLDRVLPKFKASGHRVLMFFQMTQVMDIMEDFLRMKNLKYMRLDGSTKADDRNTMLKEFNAPDSDYFCFLLSTRAGGLGLNLQTADTVIIFDTDWNPHQDLQAQDRAHRIGQKNEVRILRLITTDSVEEVILERAMQKLDIDGKVIQAGKFDNKSTAEEQEAFLRRLIESESTKENDGSAEFDDDELNQTLARSDEEKILFDKMDQERVANEVTEAKKNHLDKPLPRLIQLDELPEVFSEDITKHLEHEPEDISKMRRTKRVYYDDGLTEEQFLEAVEDENITLEEAIEKKRLAREKRQRQKHPKENGVEDNVEDETDTDLKETKEIRTLENTPDASIDKNLESLDEQEDHVNKPHKRSSRGRSKRKLSEPVEEEHKEAQANDVVKNQSGPEPKKPRLRVKLSLKGAELLDKISLKDEGQFDKKPKESKKAVVKIINGKTKSKAKSPTLVTDKIDEPKVEVKSETSETETKKHLTRKELSSMVETLVGELRNIEDDVDNHKRTDIFEVLPSKTDYPDYYKLIKKPVSLEKILQSAQKRSFKNIEEVKTKFDTMFSNAKFYNEEGSWVYNDAIALNEYTNKWFSQYITEVKK